MNEKSNIPFWLVWRDGGWAPQYKHDSRKSAENEAERLARENPGQDFYVLMPVSRTVKSDVVTERFFDDELPF